MKAILRLLAISACALGLAAAAPAWAEGDGDAHGAHLGDTHAQGADVHGAHGDAHAPTFDDVNWFYGFLGEKEGVEPDLLWRPTGMPVPLSKYVLFVTRRRPLVG